MADTNLPGALRRGIDTTADGARALARLLGDAGEVVLRERPTMEHVLLVLFLVVGAYMYHGATEFSPDAATFPRLTAGVTVVLSALLLVRNYLPGPVRSLVAEPMQVLGGDDVGEDNVGGRNDDGPTEAGGRNDDGPTEAGGRNDDGPTDVEIDDDPDAAELATAADADDDAMAETTAATYTYDIDDPRGPAITSALCVVYVGLTFTIGMLYATPIFVALYALWVRMRWHRALVLIAVGFGIAYAFFLLVTPEIAVGWYTGWRFPVPEIPELTLSLAATADGVIPG